MFRKLNADEIECRVNTINEKGLSLFLYKDARVDMFLLDETVGPKNWQRSHSRDNANCTVSIWDDEKKQWISKEDTGTESFAEKEKGLASGSFKRACTNWGIGRELYTSPFIWINVSGYKPAVKNNKPTTYDKFIVDQIMYDGDNIIGLVIKNTNSKKIVYTMGSAPKMPKNDEPIKEKTIPKPQQDILLDLILQTGSDANSLLAKFKIKDVSELTEAQYQVAIKNYTSKLEKR